MKYLILFCLLLASCASNPNHIYSRNACLPNVVSFQDAYKENNKSKNSWSRLFIYGHHAFCVYSLEDKIWIYDVRLGARQTNVKYENRNEIKGYFVWVGNGLDFTDMVWIGEK